MTPADAKLLGIPLLAWIPLLPLLGALINLTIGRKASRGFVHFVAVASVAASCALSIYMIAGPLVKAYQSWRSTGSASIVHEVYTWIEVGSFKVELAFRLDTLSAVMIGVVTFVGTLIHVYSTGYMAHDKGYARYFGYLNLFTGSMLILVLGANLPVMFIGWEGVGLCSYLLIGFWFDREEYATAGKKAFIVNRIGDFCFLLGMFLLYWAVKDQGFSQSLDFADLARPEATGQYVKELWFDDRLAAAAGVLLFMGAAGKSAQIPLYTWLPDAMAGPTPVSALIHAATMVTAGVYMVCRLSFLYASSTTAMIVVCSIGLLTALVAAFYAFAQTDLKKVLAYSTVSQLGFMFVAAGTGNWVAAIFHLGTHAFFKAGLFLGAGSVMHAMEHAGSHVPGDITQMGGLRKRLPITHLCFLIYCLTIAGFPLTAGFFSKDEILAGSWIVSPPGWPAHYGKVLWVGLMLAALGTAFYMWRLYFLVFAGKPRSAPAETAEDSPKSMTLPLVVLAALSLFAGYVGLPHLEKLHDVPKVFHGITYWLEPAVAGTFYEGAPIHPHVSDGVLIGLMAGATAVGLLGIALAWVFYGRGPSKRVDELVAGPLQPLYQASKNKLWVDEFYDAVIVRPYKALCRGMFEIVDRFIIDTVLVNGAALAFSMFSRIAAWVQNGQVQRYLLGVVIGAAAVFAVTSWAHEPTFRYREHGGLLELRAEPGEGIAGRGCKLGWDLDDDGKPDDGLAAIPYKPDSTAGLDAAPSQLAPHDLERGVVRIQPGAVGGRATLFLDCPLGGKQTFTRTIRLADNTAKSAQEAWR